MRLEKRNSNHSPILWAVTIVALSALYGFVYADDPSQELAKKKQTTTVRVESQPPSQSQTTQSNFEAIELTLAQAGCPGWMVLASEGEEALHPPHSKPSGQVRQTAFQDTENASQQIAPRMLLAAQATRAQAIFSSKDDPNDLLDGVPDLLAAPAAEQAVPAAKLQEPIHSNQNADVTNQEVEPQLPEPPSGIPDTPSVAMPTTEPKLTEQPKLEQPMLLHQQQEPEIQKPALEAQAPQQPHKSPQPVLTPPERTAPEQIDVPRPKRTIPIQPQPKQTQPFETRPSQHKPTQHKPTQPKPTQPKPTQPKLELLRPELNQPTQSPFAPPPQPKQPTPHSISPQLPSSPQAGKKPSQDKTYCEFVAESQYPSAFECAKCHQKIFDEWKISSHAYAAISPMFHKFEQTINNLSQGTVGYFCYRCHVPVGTNLGVSRAAPLWDLPQVAREGVTCIACHRVNQRYGKVNGHRRIEPGGIHDKVYGSIGGGGIAEVIAKKDHYKVKTSTSEKGPGQDIHVVGEQFDQLGKSEFCVSCHQVAVHPGIKLEVVWEQYRASPACKKGVSCQDCHMGRLPGVPSGYEYGAAAEINGKAVNKNRKHANHVFYGPGYSIAHPGVFPHNKQALRWPMQEWLQFNWRAGWGTEEFEQALEEGQIYANFPPKWAEADDRYDAREIIDDNLKLLELKKISRQQTLENGSHVDGPYFDTPLVRGQKLKFHYIMTNTNEGHNLPSGSLGAQPQLWANVVLIGPRGQRLWESGYTDSYGDVADIHSTDVRNKRVPYDWQLFNLQTMFLITGAKGTDREFPLPVNIDIDQLPFLRPGAQPISVINHPPFIRMEGRSLAPLASRKIPYQIPTELMREPGHYRLSFRLRSRAEPIYFMRFCNSTKEMNRAMNEWTVDFHESSVEFFVR